MKRDHSRYVGSRLLTVRELQSRLNCSRTVAYELIAKRALPSIRLGTAIRVPEVAVDDFILSQLADGDVE